MNNRAIKFFSISGMLILVGCVSQPTLPGAQSILLVNQSPDSEDCTLLGGISSSQGNMLSGGMVSDDNLITAVKNDMRNQTYLLGGNVVYIQELKLNALYAMSTNNASGQAKAFNCNNNGLVVIANTVIDSNLPIKSDSTVVTGQQGQIESVTTDSLSARGVTKVEAVDTRVVTETLVGASLPLTSDSLVAPAPQGQLNNGINAGATEGELIDTLGVGEASVSATFEPVIVNKVVGTSEMANGLRYAQLGSAYGDQYVVKIAQSTTYSSAEQQELCSLSKQAADNFVKAEAIFRKCKESIWNTFKEIKASGFNAQVSRGFIADYQGYYQSNCLK